MYKICHGISLDGATSKIILNTILILQTSAIRTILKFDNVRKIKRASFKNHVIE